MKQTIRWAGVALLIFLSPTAAWSQSEHLSWPEPTETNRPWTRWWWMGSAVDRENLTWNLETLAEAGFGGVEITAIYGAEGEEHRFIDYLSSEWLAMLSHTIREAERLGMGVDMPPGSGWRTGGPFVREDFANASLYAVGDSVTGGQTWRLVTGERASAVVAYSSDGRRIDILDQTDSADGTVWEVPPGDWVIYTVQIRPSGEEVKRPGPGGEGLTIDPFSRESVSRFFQAYEERTENLSHGSIRSWFHDSFEYTGNSSWELFEDFGRRRGYDVRCCLPALAGIGSTDDVARVKADYRWTLSDMLTENFSEFITTWAHERGSLFRNQAHGSPANLLDVYAASDIPETEIFGPIGKSDNDLFISKFASSAAHVAGRQLTSAETGTWLEEHFTVSLDLLKQAVDQLFVSGVNHIFFHGTAYSPRDVPWPGWLFYASTQVNPNNAIWRDLPALNEYITRVQSVLQEGNPDNEVLLYWPVHDNWHDGGPLRMDFRVHSPDWFYDKPISDVAALMWERGYGFDYVSDRLLKDAHVSDGGTITTPGASYRAIVLPKTEYMPLETFEKLHELVLDGATVIVQESLPADIPGFSRLEERRSSLNQLKYALQFADLEGGIREARHGRGRWLEGDSVEQLLVEVGIPREAMADHEGIQFIRRSNAAGHDYFIRNSGETPLDGWVSLGVDAASAALMDPASDGIGLARLDSGSGATQVYLQLQPGASTLLRTFTSEISGPDWTYILPVGEPFPIDGMWDITFVEGGPELPLDFETEDLISWTESGDAEAARFSGTALYRIQFDGPGPFDRYLLDLGDVAESARVRLNDQEPGTLLARPFTAVIGPLKEQGNMLEIEVTNLSANRIRDMDRREEQWKVFHDINFVDIRYQPFDASGWPILRSGLLGPVTLTPLD